MMRGSKTVALVGWLPQLAISGLWGWLASRRRPRWLARALVRLFVRAVGVDLAEAEDPDPRAYPCLQALFVRRLAPGRRPADPDPRAIVSPVDGTVGASGPIDGGRLFQVKGSWYPLATLLGDAEDAAAFAGGSFLTLYLAPDNYHRIHAPVAGTLAAATYLPGALMPVFPQALAQVPALLCRNERTILYLEGAAYGRLALVLVGATLVGRIALTLDPGWPRRQRRRRARQQRAYTPPHQIGRGDDLAAFELGSTVVLVAPRGGAALDALAAEQPVRVGRRIGALPGAAADAGRGHSDGSRA